MKNLETFLLSAFVLFSSPLHSFADSPVCHEADLRELYEEHRSALHKLYFHLHQNPELSLEEASTAKRMAEEFRSAGFEVTEEVGGTGVVAVLKNGDGPTVLIRTDMDALPIEEETGADYASKVKSQRDGNEVGVMHACGHDVHMSSVASSARLLSKMKEKWSGTLVAIAQPAEEIGAGARAMLNDKLFTRFPKPDYLIAHHVDAGLEAGKISIKPEYFTANVDSIDILVKGQGGHGAKPHLSKDPVVLASQLVLALQTIVSREIKPTDPVVLTVGSIHGGTKHNIIPDEVRLQITLRTYKDEVREQAIAAIKRIADGIAAAAGLKKDLYPVVSQPKKERTPAGYNSPEMSRQAFTLWRQVFSPESVVEGEPSMGGEDFANYGYQRQRIPSLMFRFGGVSQRDFKRSKAKGAGSLPPIHSSKFLPDYKTAIETGSIAMSTLALKLFDACDE